MSAWFRKVGVSLKRTCEHEPHLPYMLGVIALGPVLSVCSLSWACYKKDCKVTRFGDNEPYLKIPQCKPTQVLFCNKVHRCAYKKIPAVEELRDSIYNYEDFKGKKSCNQDGLPKIIKN